jgi:cephalosporin hydroxylase
MPRLPTGVRRRLRDKALAASRRLSTGPEWERRVRREFGLLAGGDGWRDQVTDGFQRLYDERGEAGGTWKDTSFLGVTTWKVPLDLWVYQELLAELRADAPMVTPGSYLVVEDTNINGHPVYEAFGPGPMEAVQDFLKERHDFEVDHAREKFLFTVNPGGWLRKVG